MTNKRRLSDGVQEVVDQLAAGVRLRGPVPTARGHDAGRIRTWGFSDGRRANYHAVLAAERRGLIAIHQEGDRHWATLAGGKP